MMFPRPRSVRSRLLGVVLLGVLALTAIGCSSSSDNGSTATSAATSPPAAASPTTSSPVTSPSPAQGELSGTWSGKYSGAFNGTFTLHWTQSSSKLTGTIDLSTAGTLKINGVVTGDSIQFGTVGSTAITYTGSVSGDSMSGTYQVAGSGGGDWSATKTG